MSRAVCSWTNQPEQISFFRVSTRQSLSWNLGGASVPLPPIALVAAAAAAAPVVVMSTSASVVMAVTAAAVSLLVIAVPAVLLMTAGTRFFGVALVPASAVLLGCWVLVGGVIVLPGARPDRFSTCQLPLLRGEAAV